jgi:restriction system protein
LPIGTLLSIPCITLQALVLPAGRTDEGTLIQAVAPAWLRILDVITKDPKAIYEIDWRAWEEIIAGAYKTEGFEVELTPRSNDKGRDVIATKRGLGTIRLFDQVKAYAPHRVVSAEEVRAMIGVLTAEGNVSKGIVTTTSHFAPGIMKDENIKRLMPYRLELKAKEELLAWLANLRSDGNQAR